MADKGARVIIVTKKVKGHAAHHGGAWKVAYADFVTAMMALFMVLWLLSQTDVETRQKLSEYFRTGMFSGAPSLVMGGTGINETGFLDAKGGVLQFEQKTLLSGAESVKEALMQAEQANSQLSGLMKQVDIQVTEQGLLIQILDGGQDLLFDLSSSELKPRLKSLLEAIAPILGKLRNQIQVHGHTDARPFPAGVNRSNWDLSYERANAARKVLDEHGLRPGQVSGVFSHASSSPYVKDDPFSPKNRRLAILAVRRGAEDLASRGIGTDVSKDASTEVKVEPKRSTSDGTIRLRMKPDDAARRVPAGPPAARAPAEER
ncbi:MAG: flagellar motor protein MotB [Polyangiaceae bacterium]